MYRVFHINALVVSLFRKLADQGEGVGSMRMFSISRFGSYINAKHKIYSNRSWNEDLQSKIEEDEARRREKKKKVQQKQTSKSKAQRALYLCVCASFGQSRHEAQLCWCNQ